MVNVWRHHVALRVLRNLASAERTIEEAVGSLEHTSWMDSKVIEFEVGIHSQGRAFQYRLHIGQLPDILKPRIIMERATCDGKLLFERDLEGVRIPKVDGTD